MRKMIFTVLFSLLYPVIIQAADSQSTSDLVKEISVLNQTLGDVSYDIRNMNRYAFTQDKKQVVITHTSERLTLVKGNAMGGYTFDGKYAFNPKDIDLKNLKNEEDDEFPGTFLIRLRCKSGGCITYQRHEIRFDKNRKTIGDRQVNIKRGHIALIINNAKKAEMAEISLKKLLGKGVSSKK